MDSRNNKTKEKLKSELSFYKNATIVLIIIIIAQFILTAYGILDFSFPIIFCIFLFYNIFTMVGIKKKLKAK